jgi:hypothetical protein
MKYCFSSLRTGTAEIKLEVEIYVQKVIQEHLKRVLNIYCTMNYVLGDTETYVWDP